ncbi:MAG TPA: IS200/IS605 family transposase [Bacteroidales bacterium]|nr:IS200/IS605 family transposase [Bacteroidales bacterium]
MPDTYTQINIHVVFVVSKRENVLLPHFKTRLCEYLHGILKKHKHFPLAVNGYYDHVHVFFEMNPSQALSDIVRDLKSVSSKWINDNKFLPGNFRWQDGYGGFSYSRSQRDGVIKYIMSQEEHHRKITFREEYLKMLKSFDIAFKEQYLFAFFE